MKKSLIAISLLAGMIHGVGAAETTPAAKPVVPAPAAKPVVPAPVAKPVVPAPVAQPAAPAPAAKPAVPAPVAAPAPPVAPAAVPAKDDYEGQTNPALCFARGLANLCTCWLEIPRCMIYDNTVVPLFGLIAGVPEGALFTVARAGTGVIDVVTLGLISDSLHGRSFPDFITQSNWMPPQKNKK